MKKILTAIAAAVLIVYPSICFASYIIHLKDGREIVTDQYWEEGEQIKFKRFGGVMGFQKDLVNEIEEKEDLPEEKAEVVKPEKPSGVEKADDVKKAVVPEAAEKTGEDVVVKEEGTGDKSEEEKKTDIAQYEREKRALREKYREARKELGRSINAGDKLGSEAAKSEMAEILDRFSEMERKIKKEEGTKK